MGPTKHHLFTVFFNHKGDVTQAEVARKNTQAHLLKLFEDEAGFAVIAKDCLNGSCLSLRCLSLRGHVNLKSPCRVPHIKLVLGKCSTCHASHFGDVANLCRLLHIDKRLIAVGKLGRGNHSSMKCADTDPARIVKILVEAIEKKDGPHNSFKSK